MLCLLASRARRYQPLKKAESSIQRKASKSMSKPELISATQTIYDRSKLPKPLASSALISPALVLRYGSKALTMRMSSLRLSRMKGTITTTSTFMTIEQLCSGGNHISTELFESLLLAALNLQNAYGRLWSAVSLKDKIRIRRW